MRNSPHVYAFVVIQTIIESTFVWENVLAIVCVGLKKNEKFKTVKRNLVKCMAVFQPNKYLKNR